jgi:hypothetical protein
MCPAISQTTAEHLQFKGGTLPVIFKATEVIIAIKHKVSRGFRGPRPSRMWMTIGRTSLASEPDHRHGVGRADQLLRYKSE